MSFDAAPRERLVSVRKPKRVEEEREPKPRKPGALRWWQILGILVVISALAYLKVEYFPSDEDIARDKEIEMTLRETRAANEFRMREMATARRQMLRGINLAECDRVAWQEEHAWECPDAAARAKLDAEMRSAVYVASPTVTTMCATEAQRVDAMAAKLGCR